MRLRKAVPLFLAAIALAACSSDLPTTPALTSSDGEPLMSSHPVLNVGICKTWLGDEPVPAIDWQFEWTATSAPAAGSTTIVPSDFNGISACISLGSWPAGTEVTVTEVVPTGYFLERILLQGRVEADDRLILDPDPPTVTFLVDTYQSVYFKNDGIDIPPPPPGGEGCTPGFWRQAQHFQYWTGFDPSDLYADVFGVDRAGTLLENVAANGGGANALARHAVAALLNAASPEVDYNLSIAVIIAGVQAAYASGNFESFKDVLEGYNEQGCSVDKSR